MDEKSNKDRGWSWVVLAAVVLAQSLTFSQILSFGIFHVILLEEFECTQQEMALMGALAFGVTFFTAVPASVAQKKYGCRRVLITGGLVASTGFLLSSFATKIWHLYLTYGILVGFGFGCTFVPSLGAIPDYFDKYRLFAAAFAPVGSALGTFIYSPFYYYLIDTYTWRGAMTILSGISLHIVLCGAVMRSRSKQKNLSWASSADTSLFKDKKFLLILIEGFFYGASTYIAFAMANTLVIKLGLTKRQSSHIVAIMGFCNLTGRLISSFASLSSRLSPLTVFALVTLVGGASSFISAVCTVWWTLALALGLYGLSFGVKLSQLAPTMIQLFGVKKFVSATGYRGFVAGISGILGPWIAGLLAEKNGVGSSYWFTGCLAMVDAGILFTIELWRVKQQCDVRKMAGNDTKCSAVLVEEAVDQVHPTVGKNKYVSL